MPQSDRGGSEGTDFWIYVTRYASANSWGAMIQSNDYDQFIIFPIFEMLKRLFFEILANK